MEWLPERGLVASGSWDKTLRCWDPRIPQVANPWPIPGLSPQSQNTFTFLEHSGHAAMTLYHHQQCLLTGEMMLCCRGGTVRW